MARDIYARLAKHLDDLPGGFPPTESGVELRILRKLFSPQDAELALNLTLIPESAKVVARRAKIPPEEAGARLDELASKGLCFSIKGRNGVTSYMASQFVIGIWEYHVNDLDPELIQDMREYIPTLFDPETWTKSPQLRTIPVGQSVSSEQSIMAYEQAGELIRKQKKLLVAPCICRKEHKMTGEGCDKPEETCLVFGLGADYYHRNGLGRMIGQEEALAILAKAEKAGLVLQPSNAEKIVNICCCCGCCCQVLKTLKLYPRPADMVASSFAAELDQDECVGCGICEDRCQMDALSLDGDKAVLDEARCIGCGLCVTTCPSGALSLVRKPQEKQPKLPGNMIEASIRLAKARGKMSGLEMAMMGIRSKVDRFLASR